MAQLIFEPFNDNQTALAVQSLLESQNIQNIPEAVTVDDDDLFQCGRCKKEFTNLMSFLSHKQGQCVAEVAANATASQSLTLRGTSMDLSASNTSIVYTTHLGHALTKQLNAYGGVSLSSLMPGMVLGDEIISFHTVDPSSTIPLSSSMQSSSYLSQVEPMTLNAKNSGPAIYSTIGEPIFAASNHDFAGVIDSSQLQFQQIATSSESQVELQQVIISMPQSESGVEALFSSHMHPSNCIMDISSHDRKMRSALDMVPAVSELDSPQPRHGKVPISPACTGIASGTPPEDASRRKLKCQYCDKAFLKNFDLQQHLRSHTGEKPFQCIVCGRAFAQKSNVKKHMQTHKVWPQGLSNTLPTPVILPVMPTSDASAIASVPGMLPSISDHLQAATVDAELDKGNGNVHVLMNCDSTTGQLFVKQWSTMISVQQDTTPEGEKVNVVVDNSYICQYCGSKFGSYFQLKSHLVIHKNEQVYKCVLKSCGECFRELDEFLEHTKIHENEMTYRCYVCNKTFSSLYELGTHQYSHSLFPNQGPKLGPKYFRCVKCKNKYATPEALQHHLETTSHNFPCPYCSKLFTCERYLRRHLPTHGTVGEYHCEVCMKPFKTEHYLKMHMVTHSDKKPFHCDKCSRSFNRRDKLKRHLLIHDPVKKFKCPFRSVGGCTKEFNRGDKLKAHIISHTGIKPYKCKICNKFFTRRPHLREHERTHTNSFQFSCSRCAKGFRRQKLLREHVCSYGSKDSSSPESPADCKEAIIQSIAEARATCFPKKKVISSKVAIPRRGRPPKQIPTVSTALQSDLSPSVTGIVNNQVVRSPKVEQQPLSLNQSSLAIAGMIAVEQPSGSGNIMTIDQALDAAANGSLHGCVDGSVGSVLTLEQSADGTFYVIKPFLGKVEDLSSACLIETSSSPIETLRSVSIVGRRSTVEDRMTLLKSGRLVTGGHTTVIMNSSADDHIPKTEVTEGLCQVIFTDDGTTG